MNCFEWSSVSSDYLDGTLMGLKKHDADQHIEECATCQRKYSHYRQILTSLNAQPRVQLLTHVNPVAWYEQTLKWLKSHPRKNNPTPWFIRGSVEGIGMAVVLLAFVVAIPKLKSFYDLQRQKRLSAYFEPLQNSLPSQEQQEAAAGLTNAPPLARTSVEALESEFETDEANEDSAAAHTTPQAAGKPGEIWRFGIKTPSPKDLRPQILKVLSGLSAEFRPEKQGGIEAPGGIQFEALIPSEKSVALKDQLQELAHSFQAEQPTYDVPDAGETNSPSTHFTWYKNRSKKPIPAGKTRVIIWLSQI